MKYYFLLISFLFSIFVFAEKVNITGIVELENGSPSNNYEVFIGNANNPYNINLATVYGVTTGINDIISEINTKLGNIYPNPVLNQLTIDVSIKKQTTINTLIFNQIGQIVRSKTVNTSEGTSVIQIQTGDTPHGVYNLQLVLDDRASFNQNFVK